MCVLCGILGHKGSSWPNIRRTGLSSGLGIICVICENEIEAAVTIDMNASTEHVALNSLHILSNNELSGFLTAKSDALPMVVYS